jgi:hypothetical protein
MNLKVIFCAFILSIANTLLAQDTVTKMYGDMITPTDLKEYLSILASDAMEGRETGKRGQKMAATFIRSHYEDLGLMGPVNGSYYQPFELYTTVQGETYVKCGDTKFKNFQDLVYYGNADSGGEISMPVIFAGKARPEDLSQINVEGKSAVVILGAEDSFRGPYDALKAKGAKMVFFFNPNPDEFQTLAAQFKSYIKSEKLSLTKPESGTGGSGVFFITPQIAEQAMKTPVQKLVAAGNADAKKNALKKFKPGNISYRHSFDIKLVKTENVLGFLEGTDKKDEIVIITSHYDHIGKKESGKGDLINNGADDDGSGTVSVMEIAKVFAQAKKDGHGPRRSILFMNFTGEEKGLLGSDYYTQHPIFPLNNTVVDLNIDMVGRRDAQHKDSAPYVYVIGADKLSSELNNLNEANNKIYTNLIFDYIYNDQSHPDRLYYRSDHWNFAKNNIPIIFYFDGIHEDYHLPSDEVDKIEFDLLTKRAQLVFYNAWQIANQEQRIMPDVKNQGK